MSRKPLGNKPDRLISDADEKWLERKRKLPVIEPLDTWEIECRKKVMVEELVEWACYDAAKRREKALRSQNNPEKVSE